MEATDNQLFIEWVEYLRKEWKQSENAIAERIMMPVHTMKNIRNGGSTAKREHLIALVRAYPELAEKAIEAGIEVEQLPAIESDVLRAIQLLREENKELRELMNEVKEKTLTQETLNRILNLIEKKS